jgi:nitric oxide reductase subunit B
MNALYKGFIGFALILLLAGLFLGIIAAIAFFKPDYFAHMMPFQQLRPFHVSAVLFWIISGAAGSIIVYKNKVFPGLPQKNNFILAFIVLWICTIILIFLSYCFEQYGGREYWEFPPVLNIIILLAWICLMISFFSTVLKAAKDQPVYVWMWSTGILFFFFTFTEQNLWHIPWFRNSFLKEMTIQWKSNGSMVGAWNQMIYGTSIYLMVQISGDEGMAKTKKAYFFYFLGLTNLIFNWGHHIYNIPAAAWIRDVSYLISMTEWLIVISIIQGFKSKLEETRKFNNLITYQFLLASEFWVFMNLVLALFMSIPAINRYTHGTHITVAHAMGTTIGINSMILLGSISYLLKMDKSVNRKMHMNLKFGYWVTQISLIIFWLALIIAGIIKGYQMQVLHVTIFSQVMAPVLEVLKIFVYSGITLVLGITIIVLSMLRFVSNAVFNTADEL